MFDGLADQISSSVHQSALNLSVCYSLHLSICTTQL